MPLNSPGGNTLQLGAGRELILLGLIDIIQTSYRALIVYIASLYRIFYRIFFYCRHCCLAKKTKKK